MEDMYDDKIRFAAICGLWCIAASIPIGSLQLVRFITYPSPPLFFLSVIFVCAFTSAFVLHIRGFAMLGKKYQAPYVILAARYFTVVIISYWILQIGDLATAYFIVGYHTHGFVLLLFYVFSALYLVGGFLMGLSVFHIRKSVGRVASWYFAIGLIWVIYLPIIYLPYSLIGPRPLFGSLPVMEIALLIREAFSYSLHPPDRLLTGRRIECAVCINTELARRR
jgi:hypothetical protein